MNWETEKCDKMSQNQTLQLIYLNSLTLQKYDVQEAYAFDINIDLMNG